MKEDLIYSRACIYRFSTGERIGSMVLLRMIVCLAFFLAAPPTVLWAQESCLDNVGSEAGEDAVEGGEDGLVEPEGGEVVGGIIGALVGVGEGLAGCLGDDDSAQEIPSNDNAQSPKADASDDSNPDRRQSPDEEGGKSQSAKKTSRNRKAIKATGTTHAFSSGQIPNPSYSDLRCRDLSEKTSLKAYLETLTRDEGNRLCEELDRCIQLGQASLAMQNFYDENCLEWYEFDEENSDAREPQTKETRDRSR